MRGLSLCAGVGGIDLGCFLAIPGYRTLCYVERDGYCIRVLKARMRDGWLHPGEIWPELGTFATHETGAASWRGQIDILSSGFPCQPASTAGKRQGRKDSRWLWPLVARSIRAVEPTWVFLENVPGLLSVNGGTAFAEILSDLAALGYDVEWTVLGAGEVGAPHRRERVFLLARKRGISLGNSADFGCGDGDKRGGGDVGAHAAEQGAATVGAESRGGVASPHGDGQPRPLLRQSPRWDKDHHAPGAGEGDMAHSQRRGGKALGDSHGRELGTDGGGALGDTDFKGRQGQGRDGGGCADELLAWPPSPSDADAWADLLARDPLAAPALPKSSFRRGPYGPPARVDRLRALGNSVVPVVAAVAWLHLRARFDAMNGEAGRRR